MACYEKVTATLSCGAQRSIHVGHAGRLVRPDAERSEA